MQIGAGVGLAFAEPSGPAFCICGISMSRVSQALDIRIPKLCMACSVLGIEYKLAGRQSVLRQCPSSLKNSICALTLLFVEGKPSAIKHLSLAWLSTCHRLEEENLG